MKALFQAIKSKHTKKIEGLVVENDDIDIDNFDLICNTASELLKAKQVRFEKFDANRSLIKPKRNGNTKRNSVQHSKLC